MKSGLLYSISIAAIVLSLVLGGGTPGHAESEGGEFGSRRPTSVPDLTPTEPDWKEQSWNLPPFPDVAQMRGAEFSLHGSDFTYWLDLDSLAVGDDGVTRYAIVITSQTGAQNVFFEGIRCQSGEYKTYAYGSQGEWHAAAYPQWQSVRLVRGSPHRRELFEYYLCSDLIAPLSREQIEARFRQYARFNEGRR